MTMSLPTPPSTAHRGKENRVIWMQNIAHSTSQRFSPTKPTHAPKPILKKTAPVVLDDSESSQRDVTPEPSDPLVDLTYLEHPVAAIVDQATALRDLIEVYSVLTARLRACVSAITDADASWPIFQPIRKKRTEFVNAVIRDLGRALETVPVEPLQERTRPLLPSPQNSPRKKKGMSAEAVKHARDLCTTSHAVIRFLALVFTVPAIYRVFTDAELRDILTQLIAIPMADELPTPNARKTCALVTWLLQCQRLPAEVLDPLSTRIVYALRRGIEGQLGKEGKKGSTSDGLKAVHDLSLYRPVTFVPAFTSILPSILGALLGNTLTLRAQACFALGGFTYAASRLPRSYIHTRISEIVRKHLTDGIPTSCEPSSAKSSPSKSSPARVATADPAIIRTLRTTLNATEPQHAAQGPVWALCVIANFIVLLGPASCNDPKSARAVHALLALAMRHKKSSVKGLVAAVWRCVTWAYFQPPLLPDPDEESEIDDEDREENDSANNKPNTRENFWKLVSNGLDLGAGVSTVWALVTASREMHDGSDHLRRAFAMLRCMIARDAKSRTDALEIFGRLLNMKGDRDGDVDELQEEDDASVEMQKLLPFSLFSNNPGLMTVDYNSLSNVVRPILQQCIQSDAIPALTREELDQEWIYDELVAVWKDALSGVQMTDDEDPPEDLTTAWEQLIKAKLTLTQDDNEAISGFAVDAIKILISLIQDPELDIRQVSPTTSAPSSSATLPASPSKSPSSTGSRTHRSLLLTTVHCLWSSIRSLIAEEHLFAAADKLLRFLVRNEHMITDDERGEWAVLCADVMLLCDPEDALPTFWARVVGPNGTLNENSDGQKKSKLWTWSHRIQSLVWEIFAGKWRNDPKGTWGGALFLLRVPFDHKGMWSMDAGDLESWSKLLEYAISSGLDFGLDAVSLLDQVASSVSPIPESPSPVLTRIADILCGTYVEQLRNQGGETGVPHALLGMVNEVLAESYPPQPKYRVQSIWLLRTLVDVFAACPPDLVLSVIEELPEGLRIWISDEKQALLASEYNDEIPLLYQSVLVAAQSVDPSPEALKGLEYVLEAAFVGRLNKPAALIEAFNDFWAQAYADMPEPAEGYPDGIRRCLGLPSIAAEAEEAQDDEAGNENVECIELDDTEPAPIYVVAAPSVLRDNTPDLEIPVPSTPPRQEICLPPMTTKSARHPKVEALFRFNPLRSPESPYAQRASPSTPRRITENPRKRSKGMSSPENVSSMKRRRLESEQDKENEAPVVQYVDGERTPVFVNTFGGKRRRSEESPDIEARVPKKSKFASGSPHNLVPPSPSPSESEDERLVAADLILSDENSQQAVSFGKTHDDDDLFVSTTHNAQNKGLFLFSKPVISEREEFVLAAVDMPSLQEVYGTKQRSPTKYRTGGLRATVSLDSRQFRFSTPPTRRSLRLSLSESRRRKSTPGRSDSASSTPTKSPSRSFVARLFGAPSPLPETNPPNSDDSIMASPCSIVAPPSSDDQPHRLGQMTPHHLISPAPRRTGGSFDDDPPSDDSVIAASPSRELITRRLQRQGSIQQLVFSSALAVMGVREVV